MSWALKRGSKAASGGRPPVVEWDPLDVMRIREVAVRLNRGFELSSVSAAVRICLAEGRLSAECAAVLSREMHSKHYVPESLRRLVAPHPALLRHARSPRETMLRGAHVPGGTRLASDGSRRLWAGERFSFDDMSQNQVVVVPWPWGGSPEADRWGHRTCRGQWLVALDDATSRVVKWVFTLRPRDSYRAADAVGLVYRSCREVCRPDEVVLEGGSWQGRRSQAFTSAAGVRVLNARGRPHLKLVENWFNRAQTWLSRHEKGQIGRFRGEMERENAVFMRCRAGSEDGRLHFPLLPELLRELNDVVRHLNGEPIESEQYGRWVPDERWELDLAAHPRSVLSDELAVWAAPERHDVVVRAGGVLRCKCVSPLGEKVPYVFAAPELVGLEGRKVRALWDAFESPVRAAVLDLRTSEPLCVAACMNEPPLPVAELDYEVVRAHGSVAQDVALKRALGGVVRSEWAEWRRSEVRGPEGLARVERARQASPIRDVAGAAPATQRADLGFSPSRPGNADGAGAPGAARGAPPPFCSAEARRVDRELLAERSRGLEEREAAALAELV